MTEPEMIRVLPVEEISASPLNPRSDLGDVSYLAASISTLGIIQPLTVRPTDNGSYVLASDPHTAEQEQGAPKLWFCWEVCRAQYALGSSEPPPADGGRRLPSRSHS